MFVEGLSAYNRHKYSLQMVSPAQLRFNVLNSDGQNAAGDFQGQLGCHRRCDDIFCYHLVFVGTDEAGNPCLNVRGARVQVG